MSDYLVTHEDSDDGMWVGEPNMFDSLDEANRWAASKPAPAMGTCRVLYRCDQVSVLAETPRPIATGKGEP